MFTVCTNVTSHSLHADTIIRLFLFSAAKEPQQLNKPPHHGFNTPYSHVSYRYSGPGIWSCLVKTVLRSHWQFQDFIQDITVQCSL